VWAIDEEFICSSPGLGQCPQDKIPKVLDPGIPNVEMQMGFTTLGKGLFSNEMKKKWEETVNSISVRKAVTADVGYAVQTGEGARFSFAGLFSPATITTVVENLASFLVGNYKEQALTSVVAVFIWIWLGCIVGSICSAVIIYRRVGLHRILFERIAAGFAPPLAVFCWIVKWMVSVTEEDCRRVAAGRYTSAADDPHLQRAEVRAK
jgi:hypothetical protein